MSKSTKNIIILVFVTIIFLVICSFLFYAFEVRKIQKIKPTQLPTKTKEHSYQDIIPNFAGFVVAKEADAISVKGIIPELGKIQREEEAILTIKFKIPPNTKITKLEITDKGPKQVSLGFQDVQLGDQVAIKTDQIDKNKKEAIATEILILEPLPGLPIPQGKPTFIPNQ
jgi:hypothetical protein